MEFSERYKIYCRQFEEFLNLQLAKMHKGKLSDRLFSAMKYALQNGGKRLRPVLFLAVYDFLRAQKYDANLAGKNFVTNESSLEKVSCAIEMLHTYTLIHDDLPCLDNDDFRRGKPSCHKVFGEPLALLAGDALLNHSFTLLFDAAMQNTMLIRAAHNFSVMTGHLGLIGGQSYEIETLQKNIYKNDDKDEQLNNKIVQEDFINIYKNKTAALFEGSVLLAAALAERDDVDIPLREFAHNFGLAFQLKDDLTDNNKESFPYFFGESKTRELAELYSENARKTARQLGSDFLLMLVDFDKYICG